MEKKLVKVVVPVYKAELSPTELSSLAQTGEVLKNYPIVLLYPAGLDISALTARYPSFETMAVSDEWIGSKNGIAGYNRMMLSREFYELFDDTEYILICHLDAWVFRDELAAWCSRGFDCVAAPWVRRKVYDYPLIRQYMWLRRRFSTWTGVLTRQVLYGKVGNGGFSLRRVESFCKACEIYKERIEWFLSFEHHLYNEDVFWAVVPVDFHYPTWQEALRFAFDANPAACYQFADRHLPFGCHGWSKRRMRRFWDSFIQV